MSDPAPPAPPGRPAGPGRLTFAAVEAGTLLALALTASVGRPSDGWWWWGGVVGGVAAGVAYWNPFRAGGFVPLGLTAALIALLVVLVWGWSPLGAVALGAGLGLALGGLNTAGKFATVPAAPLPVRVGYAAVAVAVLALQDAAVDWGWVDRPTLEDAVRVAGLVVLSPTVVAAWLNLFRPMFELTAEAVLWPMYRVRPAGPGVAHVPPVGPCLVLANHSCWFDPIFLGKVLPRRTTPMMTSRFYDLPVLGWLMRRFGVIRVPDHHYRHEAPEIDEAIAALDRGECVVLFPEGFLRRLEERPLRRFGRGIWQILQARPGTPVFACWIEGGWGSYTSYWNGRPTKNKRKDWGRPIRVAVADPVTVGADVLASHMPTRVFLMNRVLEARKLLGLPELPAVVLPDTDGGEDG